MREQAVPRGRAAPGSARHPPSPQAGAHPQKETAMLCYCLLTQHGIQISCLWYSCLARQNTCHMPQKQCNCRWKCCRGCRCKRSFEVTTCSTGSRPHHWTMSMAVFICLCRQASTLLLLVHCLLRHTVRQCCSGLSAQASLYPASRKKCDLLSGQQVMWGQPGRAARRSPGNPSALSWLHWSDCCTAR